MSTQVPAKIERVFAVSRSGEVQLVQPQKQKKVEKLTSGQRHAAWRYGLMALDQFMKNRGFISNSEFSSTHFSWTSGKFNISVSLREPRNIAYVTSHAGYDPFAARRVVGKDSTGAEMYGINARVTRMGDVCGTSHVLMVDVTGGGEGTRNPFYIPLPEDTEKPAHYVFRNVLGIVGLMCENIPKLKAEFDQKTVREAQENMIDSGEYPEV